MVRLFVAIDDTDDLESKGTGDIAQEIIDAIHRHELGRCSRITRHQLLVHEDIAYTSHNSAMCFEVQTDLTALDGIRTLSETILTEESSQEADPGLCMYRMGSEETQDALIRYGTLAKEQIFKKEDAYALAQEHDVFLKEYGGTGIGVIGALAGVGLRLGGNDGRFKGKLCIDQDTLSVKELLDYDEIDDVQTPNGSRLDPDNQVTLDGKIKTVFLEHQSVLIVEKDQDTYINASKRVLRGY